MESTRARCVPFSRACCLFHLSACLKVSSFFVHVLHSPPPPFSFPLAPLLQVRQRCHHDSGYQAGQRLWYPPPPHHLPIVSHHVGGGGLEISAITDRMRSLGVEGPASLSSCISPHHSANTHSCCAQCDYIGDAVLHI